MEKEVPQNAQISPVLKKYREGLMAYPLLNFAAFAFFAPLRKNHRLRSSENI